MSLHAIKRTVDMQIIGSWVEPRSRVLDLGCGRGVLLEYLVQTKDVHAVGVDLDFIHSAPLDASGNALGPFTVGQVVRVITEVSNSSGTRTTAPRTITIEEPIG